MVPMAWNLYGFEEVKLDKGAIDRETSATMKELHVHDFEQHRR